MIMLLVITLSHIPAVIGMDAPKDTSTIPILDLQKLQAGEYTFVPVHGQGESFFEVSDKHGNTLAHVTGTHIKVRAAEGLIVLRDGETESTKENTWSSGDWIVLPQNNDTKLPEGLLQKTVPSLVEPKDGPVQQNTAPLPNPTHPSPPMVVESPPPAMPEQPDAINVKQASSHKGSTADLSEGWSPNDVVGKSSRQSITRLSDEIQNLPDGVHVNGHKTAKTSSVGTAKAVGGKPSLTDAGDNSGSEEPPASEKKHKKPGHESSVSSSDDSDPDNGPPTPPPTPEQALQEKQSKIESLGKWVKRVGYLSGATAAILGISLAADPQYFADHIGNVAFGHVNGAFVYLIVFGLLSIVGFLWAACFWNNKNGTSPHYYAIRVAIGSAVCLAGSATFGILAATNIQVGTVSVGNVGGTGIMIVGFSVLALIAIIWGHCCQKHKNICGKTANC